MQNVLEYMKEIFTRENLKYDEEYLKKVVDYCIVKYKNITKANVDMITHVVGVAELVASIRLDDISIYAALLHGMVKCEDFNKAEFEKTFSKEILDIVLTIDRLSYLNLKTKEKLDNEILRNMFMAIAKDIRTVIIKLCDRLYNMRNIKNVDNEEVKINMAKECLSIYAPIAHRLGMSQIKSELEDTSFRILMFDEYNLIKSQIDEKKKEREKYIDCRINEIQERLLSEGIKSKIYGRPKHFYSIYKKMKAKNCRADDLFDLLAIRIIVDDIKDCYTALGIVHDMYKPMPGRFKDYIAVPKTNMYQSLHTTVFGEDARPFEIQIRTWDMHKVADYGIAAHFSYKEKKTKQTEVDKKLVWLRHALEIQKEIIDTSENIKKIKVELFGEEVFVFTPKGDIKALPKGATPIDFAYMIHQKVAEKMIGAKINSKMVPINQKLENTDVVEIITSTKSEGPSSDWLKYAKTSTAKNKITSFLKTKNREENILKGKELFEKEVKKQKLSKHVIFKDEYLNKAFKFFSYNSIDDVYENIGFHSISPLKFINKLVEIYEKENKVDAEIKIKKTNDNVKNDLLNDSIIVEKITNCKVALAKCCMPIKGDEIIGYITNANGVSVHRKDCKNIKTLNIEKRGIKVFWKEEGTLKSQVKVQITASNKDTVITDVLQVISMKKITVNSIITKISKDKELVIDIVLNINDVNELKNLIKDIKKISSVFDIRRIK